MSSMSARDILAARDRPEQQAPASLGPYQCCPDFSIVTICDGVTDTRYCGICESTFTQPCPEAELLPIAAGAKS